MPANETGTHLGAPSESQDDRPSSSRAQPACAPAAKPSRLWLWVVAAFALQAAVWTAWFIIASHYKVQEVPLATKGGR